MSLNDFFRINMPYGLKRNSKDEWFVFNREYVPLGWNSTTNSETVQNDDAYSSLPVYTKYRGLTEQVILNVFADDKMIQRNADGKISCLFLYDDRTNPQSAPQYWDQYFEKIKFLSKFASTHS